MSHTDVSDIRQLNWEGGYIPVIITLATSSLSSSAMPAPIHVLLHRQTFLHVGLSSAVDRLSKCAVVANARDGYWFEDDKYKLPLRWQLFTGVLFDLLHGCCHDGINREIIPWRIRLHFTSYPVDEILRCHDGILTVRQAFANSLKQSLYLQFDSSKIAMQVSKQAHDNLWGSAISRSNYVKFSEFCKDYMPTNERLSFIPVRVYVDNRPSIQKPCNVHLSNDTHKKPLSLKYLLQEWLPDLFDIKNNIVLKENSDNKSSSSVVRWKVQGIEIPLDMALIDVWRNLCSPDLFLYIIVSTS